QQINEITQLRVTIRELVPNPGENQRDFSRRTIAELTAHNTANDSLQIDKAEFERLPNKRTESQINDRILSEVLKTLEKYLNEK
ncbi:unnamed protein product, partial [Rotaria sp. Silwood2]